MFLPLQAGNLPSMQSSKMFILKCMAKTLGDFHPVIKKLNLNLQFSFQMQEVDLAEASGVS